MKYTEMLLSVTTSKRMGTIRDIIWQEHGTKETKLFNTSRENGIETSDIHVYRVSEKEAKKRGFKNIELEIC